MFSVFRTLSLRYLSRRWFRAFLIVLSIALGVATLSHRHFENRFLPPEKRAKRTPTGLRSR